MIELMIFLIQIIELIIKFNLYYTLDDICLPGAIRELCEARDSGVVQFVDCEQYCWVCFILAFPVLMYYVVVLSTSNIPQQFGDHL